MQGAVAVTEPRPVCVIEAVAVVTEGTEDTEGTEGRQTAAADCVEAGAASWVCVSGWAIKYSKPLRTTGAAAWAP